MAELTIRPEEIRDALSTFFSSYTPEAASRTEVGRVLMLLASSVRSRRGSCCVTPGSPTRRGSNLVRTASRRRFTRSAGQSRRRAVEEGRRL